MEVGNPETGTDHQPGSGGEMRDAQSPAGARAERSGPAASDASSRGNHPEIDRAVLLRAGSVYADGHKGRDAERGEARPTVRRAARGSDQRWLLPRVVKRRDLRWPSLLALGDRVHRAHGSAFFIPNHAGLGESSITSATCVVCRYA